MAEKYQTSRVVRPTAADRVRPHYTYDEELAVRLHAAGKKIHFDDRVMRRMFREAGVPDSETTRTVVDAVYQRPRTEAGWYGRTAVDFGDATPGEERDKGYYITLNMSAANLQGRDLADLELVLRRGAQEIASYRELGLLDSPAVAERYQRIKNKRMTLGTLGPALGVLLTGTFQGERMGGGPATELVMAGAGFIGAVLCYRTAEYVLEAHDPSIPHSRIQLPTHYQPAITLIDKKIPTV